MWRKTVATVMLLVLVISIGLAATLPRPSSGQGVEIIVGADETLVWADGDRVLDGRVTIYGEMVVRDYNVTYNVTRSGEVAFIVMAGGSLTFERARVEAENYSQYMFFKVEGSFVARDSYIDHLSGSFADGGGIKCMGGTVDLTNVTIDNCQSMAIYASGASAHVTMEGHNITGSPYGVVAKEDATVILRNVTFEGFTNYALQLNGAVGEVVGCHFTNPVTTSDGPTATGIGARASELEVRDTNVSFCPGNGFELVDLTTADIVGCEVYNCTAGIRMSELDGGVTVSSTDIKGCVDAFNINVCAGILIEGCSLTRNINGVASNNCPGDGYTLRNNHIGGNFQLGAYVIGKGFNEEGTVWTDAAGTPNGIARMKQLWTLYVYVEDSNKVPVVGADIKVRSANNTLQFNYSTNSAGNVSGGIKLEGYIIDNAGTRIDAGDYKVEIKSGLNTVKKTVVMDQDRQLNLTLGDVIEISPLRTPLGWATIILIFVAIGAGAAYWYLRLR